jgi:hypothetical protein
MVKEELVPSGRFSCATLSARGHARFGKNNWMNLPVLPIN